MQGLRQQRTTVKNFTLYEWKNCVCFPSITETSHYHIGKWQNHRNRVSREILLYGMNARNPHSDLLPVFFEEQ